MQPLTPHEEPELEALLRRLAPDLVARWKPATAGQIAELEGVAGRPLPPFYCWYLSRMGQDNARIFRPRADFDVGRVLEHYRENEVVPDGRMLLLAIEEDDQMQMHPFYDLDVPARQDCLVGLMGLEDDFLRPRDETLREMIAAGAFFRWRVRRFELQCTGMIASDDGDPVAARLKEGMRDAGFNEPVIGGDHFGIFDREDAAMSGNAAMDLPPHTFGFTFGGDSEASMRRTLGTLGVDTGLKVTVDEWTRRPR